MKTNTYGMQWDEKLIGNLTKDSIRESASEIYGNDHFGTLEDIKEKENGNYSLKVELANASEPFSKELGQKYAKEVSILAGTEVKFVRHSSRTESEDISGYEPGKISHGTYVDITYIYAILELINP